MIEYVLRAGLPPPPPPPPPLEPELEEGVGALVVKSPVVKRSEERRGGKEGRSRWSP